MSAYRSPLFEPERLRELRLLPTEYLYYYYRPDVALANMKRAGSSRGAAGGEADGRVLPTTSAPRAPRTTLVDRYQRLSRRRAMAATCSSKPAQRAAHQARLGRAVRLRSHRADDHARHRARTRAPSFRSTSPIAARCPSSTTTTSSKCRAAWIENGPQPQAVAPIPDHPRELIDAREDLRTRDGQGGADRRPKRARRCTGAESARASSREQVATQLVAALLD